jgi:hypothetical protein
MLFLEGEWGVNILFGLLNIKPVYSSEDSEDEGEGDSEASTILYQPQTEDISGEENNNAEVDVGDLLSE